MEANNMIRLQDEFIASVSRVSFAHRNYYAVVTKASRKLRAGVEALGFDIAAAERAVADAYDMAKIEAAR